VARQVQRVMIQQQQQQQQQQHSHMHQQPGGGGVSHGRWSDVISYVQPVRTPYFYYRFIVSIETLLLQLYRVQHQRP
jgi:hypothetical protein